MSTVEDQKKEDEAPAVNSGAAPTSQRPRLIADLPAMALRDQRWLPNPDKVWLAARSLAAGILVVWFLGWAAGSSLATREITGLTRITPGYSGAVVILAFTNSLLVLAAGYLLRSALRLEATAESLGQTVRNIEPALKSDAVKSELDMLGGEVDSAILKLAKAEKQIREQVGAIDAATETLHAGTTQGTERLAKERQALIDATKAMNSEADNFARALAERSKNAQNAASAELPNIEEKLQRLESVSKESAEQFASLREALAESSTLLREAPAGLAGELKSSTDTLRQAQQDLINESEKLSKLIDQQRDRADSLGRSLALQSEKLKKRQPVSASKNLGGSWRRILDKVEEQVGTSEPLLTQPKPGNGKPQPEKSPEETRLDRMTRFTLALKAQLFGMPTKHEQQRFEDGERQLFTKQILEHDQIELRARLRATIENDDSFAEASENFLTDFDALLAPVMSDDSTDDDTLQTLLHSPMGKLYVAIGTAKGHFV